MGTHPNIGKHRFPKQGKNLNRRVKVIFDFNTSDVIFGLIVRDDMEAPWQTIIRLDDGKTVLGTECQYSVVKV